MKVLWLQFIGRFAGLSQRGMQRIDKVQQGLRYGAQCLAYTGLSLLCTFIMAPASGVADTGQPNPSASSPGGDMLKGYRWLAKQPASNYTLQLMASENRAGVEFFAKQRDIAAPFAVFAQEHKGKTLYALVQGSFSDRSAAEQAVGTVPEGIKPWIRSIKSVHKVMLQTVAAAPTEQEGSAPVSPAAVSARIEDTAWVWSRNPRHYTVQLVSAIDEQTVEANRQRHSLPGKMAVVQIPRGGRIMYTLLYGSFSTKAAARDSIQKLPESLQQLNPRARDFAELQDAISTIDR
ncbi:MAG: SPOR domain-containing protein [Pseudomonadota bacterium]